MEAVPGAGHWVTASQNPTLEVGNILLEVDGSSGDPAAYGGGFGGEGASLVVPITRTKVDARWNHDQALDDWDCAVEEMNDILDDNLIRISDEAAAHYMLTHLQIRDRQSRAGSGSSTLGDPRHPPPDPGRGGGHLTAKNVTASSSSRRTCFTFRAKVALERHILLSSSSNSDEDLLLGQHSNRPVDALARCVRPCADGLVVDVSPEDEEQHLPAGEEESDAEDLGQSALLMLGGKRSTSGELGAGGEKFQKTFPGAQPSATTRAQLLKLCSPESRSGEPDLVRLRQEHIYDDPLALLEIYAKPDETMLVVDPLEGWELRFGLEADAGHLQLQDLHHDPHDRPLQRPPKITASKVDEVVCSLHARLSRQMNSSTTGPKVELYVQTTDEHGVETSTDDALVTGIGVQVPDEVRQLLMPAPLLILGDSISMSENPPEEGPAFLDGNRAFNFGGGHLTAETTHLHDLTPPLLGDDGEHQFIHALFDPNRRAQPIYCTSEAERGRHRQLHVIVLMGLPGCGKSSFAANLCEKLEQGVKQKGRVYVAPGKRKNEVEEPLELQLNARIICQDQLGTREACLQRFHALVRSQFSRSNKNKKVKTSILVLVIDRTNICELQRQYWVNAAAVAKREHSEKSNCDGGLAVRTLDCVWFDHVDADTCVRRMVERGQEPDPKKRHPSLHGVTWGKAKSILRSFEQSMEEPRARAEGFQEVKHLQSDEDVRKTTKWRTRRFVSLPLPRIVFIFKWKTKLTTRGDRRPSSGENSGEIEMMDEVKQLLRQL
eukprot:g14125.t1